MDDDKKNMRLGLYMLAAFSVVFFYLGWHAHLDVNVSKCEAIIEEILRER